MIEYVSKRLVQNSNLVVRNTGLEKMFNDGDSGRIDIPTNPGMPPGYVPPIPLDRKPGDICPPKSRDQTPWTPPKDWEITIIDEPMQ